jgi:formylglycine-generating enzyme required for sulfatase activity
MKLLTFFFIAYCFLFSKDALQGSSALEKSRFSGMVLVPEGLYTSGSNEYNDERPRREIYLDTFYIDKFEVTQKEFKKIMKVNPSEFRGESLPVDRVDWYQARDYCNKSGKRLPTEVEWEKSARSGSHLKYYWGEGAGDSFAWHWENSGRKTHPVGEKEPNKLGLYDTAGNVWEWTEDWYDQNYYQKRASRNPRSPFNGKHRVLRGGSFMDKPDGLRVTRRNWDLPSSKFKNFGFRCAKNQNTISID